MNQTRIILFLFTLLILPGCHRTEGHPEFPAPKVEGDRIELPADGKMAASILVQPAALTASNRKIYNGRLLWNDDLTVRIFTPFSGRITNVLVKAGERVEREQALALINSPDFGQAQSDARRAESDFNQSEKNVSRLKELFEHGAAARKDLDAALSDLSRLGAERQRALSRLQFYGGNGEGVDQIFPLKSPLAGVVVEKNINPGQEVRPDQMLANVPQFFTPLFVVTDPSRLWVQIDISEKDLNEFRPGERIIVRSQGFPDDQFGGRIETISEFLDPLTHTVKVRGSVDNSHRKLKAEMYVTVEPSGSEFPEIEISSKAVLLRGEKHFIFVEEKRGTFLRREVQVSKEEGNRVIIPKGVSPGEPVVSEGALLLEQIFQNGSGA
jgi:cobalt-zinc-cadmium efflux system membrane fusion protein